MLAEIHHGFSMLLPACMLSCKQHRLGMFFRTGQTEGLGHGGFLARSLFLALKPIIFIETKTCNIINNLSIPTSFKNYIFFFNDILRKLISQTEFCYWSIIFLIKTCQKQILLMCCCSSVIRRLEGKMFQESPTSNSFLFKKIKKASSLSSY